MESCKIDALNLKLYGLLESLAGGSRMWIDVNVFCVTNYQQNMQWLAHDKFDREASVRNSFSNHGECGWDSFNQQKYVLQEWEEHFTY